MKSVLFGAAIALALSSGVALAAGNPAIGNQTTTSMGAPPGSPGYKAPRSEVVPGLPAQTRATQEHKEMMQGTEHDANADGSVGATASGNQTAR